MHVRDVASKLSLSARVGVLHCFYTFLRDMPSYISGYHKTFMETILLKATSAFNRNSEETKELIEESTFQGDNYSPLHYPSHIHV